MKVVLDTNVWLDWLVFDDPAVAPLRAAFEAGRLQVLIDAACEEELASVLGYRFYGEVLPDDKQAACLSECRRIATRVEVSSGQPLPSCRDPDDQKFLQLALGAGVDALITKDAALLSLSHRVLAFRIVEPGAKPLLQALQ